MMKLRTQILMTACIALTGAAVLSSEALAAAKPAASTAIYGAGSSLVAPYWVQTGNCFGATVPLLEETSVSPPSPPISVTITPFNYVASKPANSQNCAETQFLPNDTLNYISTGSGIGVAGVYSHDPKQYGFVNQSDTQYYPSVQYGLSDYGIVQNDVNIYNNGGTEGSVSVEPYGTPASGSVYANPLQLYGPLVVFPFSVDPVTIAYNSVYEKVYNPSTPSTPTTYSFNVKIARADGSGGLRLSPATYCKIFTGEITNWNDPAITADNSGLSLRDPNDPTPKKKWSVPIQIVGRSDSSGTTSIWYRHLATICGTVITADSNPYAAAGSKTLPGSLLDSGETTSAPGYSTSNPNYPAPALETVGHYTTANLNSGVAQYVAFTAVPNGDNGNFDSSGTATPNAITLGRIGYLGPDYALPYVTSTGANTYGLHTATLKNATGQWESPSPTTALAAFSVLNPPAGSAATDPANWVVGIAAGSSIANPTTSGSYPIVGTTNFFGYQCYATAGRAKEVVNLINYVENKQINTDRVNGILAKAGLGPVPKAWGTAILDNFVNNTSGNGLTFAAAGTAGSCSVSGVIGG